MEVGGRQVNVECRRNTSWAEVLRPAQARLSGSGMTRDRRAQATRLHAHCLYFSICSGYIADWLLPDFSTAIGPSLQSCWLLRELINSISLGVLSHI